MVDLYQEDKGVQGDTTLLLLPPPRLLNMVGQHGVTGTTETYSKEQKTRKLK